MYIDRTHAPSANVIERLTSAIARGVGNIRRRRHFKRLIDLDDHLLDDVGVTRAEVERAARLPLSVNAAIELRRMSLERRRARM